jgi:hypothetical protein
MIQTILLTALSTQLSFSKPAFTAAPSTPQVIFTRVLPEENYVSYSVGKNDTLQSISLKYYGSTEYWTTLWNDNTWISDPNNLAVGRMIKINTVKPSKPEQLNAGLTTEDQTQTEKEDEVYLQKIGYLPGTTTPLVMTPVPTIVQNSVTPTPTTIVVSYTPSPVVTQAPVVVSNAVSPISDAAITYLGNCEAGMDASKNTGNGYYGAFQFSYGTWQSLNTGYQRADLAPIGVQEAAVKQLLQRSSVYNQFPACAQKMHSAGLM